MCGAELMARRAVHSVLDMPLHRFDDTTWAHMFHPEHLGLVDPFIGVDAFHMPQNFFLPHPHGGMSAAPGRSQASSHRSPQGEGTPVSAVTQLHDDSPGGVVNRDSLGDHSVIAPGDLHWTQAGRGIVHEETPSQPGQPAVGLQIFVNMARAHKQSPAGVFKIAGSDMPVWEQDGVRVKVAAGRFRGLASPINGNPAWVTPVDLLDVRMQADATFEWPLEHAKNGFVLVLGGTLKSAEHAATAPQALVLSPAQRGDAGQGMVMLEAGVQGSHAVCFSGLPLREPVVPYGPFVGNSREDIAAYARAFQSGAMGELSASFDR